MCPGCCFVVYQLPKVNKSPGHSLVFIIEPKLQSWFLFLFGRIIQLLTVGANGIKTVFSGFEGTGEKILPAHTPVPGLGLPQATPPCWRG